MSYSQAYCVGVLVKELITVNGDYDVQGKNRSGTPGAIDRKEQILNFKDDPVLIEVDLLDRFMA